MRTYVGGNKSLRNDYIAEPRSYGAGREIIRRGMGIYGRGKGGRIVKWKKYKKVM